MKKKMTYLLFLPFIIYGCSNNERASKRENKNSTIAQMIDRVEERRLMDNLYLADQFIKDDSLAKLDLRNTLESINYPKIEKTIQSEYVLRLCENTGDDYAPLKIYSIHKIKSKEWIIIEDVMRGLPKSDSAKVKKVFKHKNVLTHEYKKVHIIESFKKKFHGDEIPTALKKIETFKLSSVLNTKNAMLNQRTRFTKWYYLEEIRNTELVFIFRCNQFNIEPEIISLLKEIKSIFKN